MPTYGVTFTNPDKLPVENVTLTVSQGIVRQVKALDEFWVDNRELTMYKRPPLEDDFVANEEWMNMADNYIEDMEWLLNMNYHEFWSTVIYHTEVKRCLASFLQEANVPYMPVYSEPIISLYRPICRFVLIVYTRLISYRENEFEWMTEEFWAEAIYINFLYTIPVIWDLCLVYGGVTKKHVSILLANVFKAQNKYTTDTATAVKFVKESFKYIIVKVNKDFECDEPINLPESFQGFGEIRKPPNGIVKMDALSLDALRDVCLHLVDTAMTIKRFVELLPEATEVLRECNFLTSVIQMYEYGFCKLYARLEELGDTDEEPFHTIEEYILKTREQFIELFQEMLAYYKNIILTDPIRENGERALEHIYEITLEVMQERRFIADYNEEYPFREELEVLRTAFPDLDPVKQQFIIDSMELNQREYHASSSSSDSDSDSDSDDETTESSSSDGREEIKTPDTDLPDTETPELKSPDPETENIPEEVRQDSCISEVKNILPDLGEGFILKCLQYYDFKVDTVVNRILEDNLDESLKAIDRTLPIIPEDPLDNKFLETGVARLNIFDGDEFDMMTRDDVDFSRIHFGKRQERDAKELLDDKTEIRQFKDRYQQFSMVADVAGYDDEYDDTYDSDGPRLNMDRTNYDDDRRPTVTPRALRFMQDEEDLESSSDSESESTPSSSANPTAGPSSGAGSSRDFCMDPAEVRARREAAWQAKRGRMFKTKPIAQPRNTDVVGKAKGQGQEKEVLHNRDKKEKNKSSRGNHNRRQGAARKRNQGMMPS